MTTFSESDHPRGQPSNAGQFRAKGNHPPATTIASSQVDHPLEAYIRQRQEAASLYLAARNTYMLANRDAAAFTLREQFPSVTTAMFTRTWEDPDDQIILAQLIGPERTIDIEGDEAEFTSSQMKAMHEARIWVQEMGEDVAGYLEPAEKENYGWYEYTLDLSTSPALLDSAAHMVEYLDEQGRDNLHFHLSERDGRMASTISRSQIEYQLTEGDIAQTDPELVQALEREYGDATKAAAEIADSATWDRFRDGVTDLLQERIGPAITDAGQALIDERDYPWS